MYIKKFKTDSKGRHFYFYFLVFILESQTIFFVRPPNFFSWYTSVCQKLRLFRYGNPNLG